MKYRHCGLSGLRLPVLSLGFWHNFGHATPFTQARDMCCRAFELGITHFDVANNYGPPAGAAEETLGRILHHDLGRHRDELLISSKAGYVMWPGPYGVGSSKKYLVASLDRTLKALGVDYVDIYYSHRYDETTPIEETMEALDQLRRQGKALHVGISSYPEAQTVDAVRLIKEMGTRLLVHQAGYSMLERAAEHGLFDVLREHGLGCVVYSGLAQGLLTDKYLSGIPAGSRAAGASPFLSPDSVTEKIVSIAHSLNAIARERGQSLAQMALCWAFRDDVVTSVALGASSISQLEENVACLDAPPFTPDQLGRIDAILAVT